MFTKRDLLEPVRSAVAAAAAPNASALPEAAAGEVQGLSTAEQSGSEPEHGKDRRSSHREASTSANAGLLGQGEENRLSSRSAEDACSDAKLSAEGATSRQSSGGSVPDGNASRSFSWNGKTEGGLQSAQEVARSLPEAVWVSSVTDEGMDDLKGAVLSMLQMRNSLYSSDDFEHVSLRE